MNYRLVDLWRSERSDTRGCPWASQLAPRSLPFLRRSIFQRIHYAAALIEDKQPSSESQNRLLNSSVIMSARTTLSDDGDPNRVCDQCRSRKIRCDRKLPCASCQIARRPCLYSILPPKPREARQRVLISSQYERKLDDFESRLIGIEGLLQKIAGVLDKSIPADADTEMAASVTLPLSRPESQLTPRTESNTPVFMGSTSLRAHTDFANKFLKERVLGSTEFHDLAPQLQAALSTLEHAVSNHSQWPNSRTENFPNQKLLSHSGVCSLPMPPIEAILRILREVKAGDTLRVTFSLICCFLTIDDFIKHCNKVCFAVEDFNLADYIIANGGLYYLFEEKAHNIDIDAEKAIYVEYRTLCKTNLELALSNLGFFMDSSKENIAALLYGVIYAIEISRPLLAFKMNSSAIQMCETLGYHRLPMSADTSNYNTQLSSESNLFWYAYMIDKGLALRLGRSSAIRDQDLSPPVIASSLSSMSPSKQFFTLWVRHSEVQGRIYDELYSFTALSSTPEHRMKRGLVLAEEVKSLIKVATDFLTSGTSKENADKYHFDGVDSLELSSRSEHVALHATLTLIYRAVGTPESSNTLSFDCFHSARTSMQLHLECMNILRDSVPGQVGYVLYTLIMAPFIPFIIIFCHAIESSSEVDLHLLREFVQSLHAIRNVSEAIDHLLSLAEVLLHIAVLCKEINKEKTEVQQSLLIGSEFDVYFSQCGFMPPLFDDMTFGEGLGESYL